MGGDGAQGTQGRWGLDNVWLRISRAEHTGASLEFF